MLHIVTLFSILYYIFLILLRSVLLFQICEVFRVNSFRENTGYCICTQFKVKNFSGDIAANPTNRYGTDK